MKKILILLITIFLICSSLAFAQTKMEILREKEELLKKLAEVQQITSNIQVRLIEIQGALKYLEEIEVLEK